VGFVYEFPPQLECPVCGVPLRPATRAEISCDLQDPSYRQLAESAAQGAREWEPPEDWAEWQKDMTPPGSWLFRCDECDHRTLWSRRRETY